MGGLAQIDDFAGRNNGHVDALVCAAPGPAELLVQIGSVLAGRDEDRCAALLGVER
jgi:hypothetical protein